MSEMPFKFFNRNQRGRDFVVGDIHGHFSALEMLLLQVNFDPEHDRVFSVGDMIDRGPESWRVIEFLNHPWFHSIMGNHEQMLLDSAFNPSIDKNWVNYNGGEWWRKIPEHYHDRIRSVVKRLPLAIEINTRSGRIGIVHADIPSGMSWRDFINQLANDADVRDQALWSRSRFKQLQLMGRTQPVEGIDMVIFGHTPVNQPLQQSNICYIDTGATYVTDKNLGHLTMLEIQPNMKIHQFCTRNTPVTRAPKRREAEKVPA